MKIRRCAPKPNGAESENMKLWKRLLSLVLCGMMMLGMIGINMIKESREEDGDELDSSFGVKAMIPLAIATSIDALAVGVTFAFLRVNIFWAVTFIGAVTFTLSSIGVKVGNVFGMRYKSKAEFVGGLILVLMGTKILLEHLGILVF